MNSNNSSASGARLSVLRTSVLAAAAVWLAGCATPGYQKSDAEASNSQAAAAAVQIESRELAATVGALSDLVYQPAADVKQQFLQFSVVLDQLAASPKRAGGNVNLMWQYRAAYFQIWDREIANIKDADIRNRSRNRKAGVSTQFFNATQQYDEAQKSLLPLIGYIQDIHTALSTDLTRHGLMSVQPSVNIANDSARGVQTALAQSATKLDSLSAQMSSSRVRDAP